ncbi:branched-chain amino acid aminotransferase [uncultured Alistipes sp.]|jgi:branched-chain-amino-acid transaminase|uniref:branched-chain amino acid aminotransferase n=1 Tax=uncultured Alistipes sp. TaxID=538949 RepID=UPI0025CD1CA0|nr:branched-chain amino acid aminotransferase [uncultured Alistipes sp.]
MEKIDWGALGFNYYKTDVNARYSFTDGKWSEMEITSDEYIKMHMSASCLHYGLELFEGLKAFRGVDGKVRLFRVEDNARRLRSSAERLCLPVPSIEMFVNACVEVVKRNEKYIPPYGTGASLYLRPVMFGTTAGLGVKPAKDALLIVYCSPVGAYFKEGIKPIMVALDREQDRAAPRGTGDVKVGGNYASSILSGDHAHKQGYSNVLYLDAQTHKYIEEFGAANFFGIKENTYVTPKSPSILPSITNMSLRQIALDLGMTVEERDVPLEELSSFEECGACGTAAVISPIGKIFDMQTEKVYNYGTEVGAKSMELYTRLQDIQYGRAEDKHNWCTIVL